MKRQVLAIATVIAVAGCSQTEPTDALRNEQQPATIPAIEVSEVERQRASRVAQAQTGIRRRPEETGAPAPAFRGQGLAVDAPDLVAAQIDTAPRVRVWARNPNGQGGLFAGGPPGEAGTFTQPILVGPLREPAPAVPTTPPPRN